MNIRTRGNSWVYYGLVLLLTFSGAIRLLAVDAAVQSPASLVDLFKALRTQEEAMRRAIVVRSNQQPQYTSASRAAIEFGKLVQRVPDLSGELPEGKRTAVNRQVQKLEKLSAIINKYARQSDATQETTNFLRHLEIVFKELQAQYSPQLTKPNPKP